MKQLIKMALIALALGAMACNNPTKTEQVKTADFIPSTRVEALVHQLTDSLGEAHAFRVERGVKQVAGLWRETDGSEEDFVRFLP